MTDANTSVARFSGKHALYRLFDAEGCLLYVGVSNNVTKRLDRHAQTQSWWAEVADCKVEFLSDRDALIAAEKTAIVAEEPRYNVLRYKNGELRSESDSGCLFCRCTDAKDAGGAPWLKISARVSAGADHLHEECRQHHARSYPEEGYCRDAPCLHCFRQVAHLLGAVDKAVGYDDPSVAEADRCAYEAAEQLSIDATPLRVDSVLR